MKAINLEEIGIEEQISINGGQTWVDWIVEGAGRIAKLAINGEITQAKQRLLLAESL